MAITPDSNTYCRVGQYLYFLCDAQEATNVKTKPLTKLEYFRIETQFPFFKVRYQIGCFWIVLSTLVLHSTLLRLPPLRFPLGLNPGL
jgi:hypothetical protein